jgi:hypothetical protein
VQLRRGKTVPVADVEGMRARATVTRGPDEGGVYTLGVVVGSYKAPHSFHELCTLYYEDPAFRRRVDDQVAQLEAEARARGARSALAEVRGGDVFSSGPVSGC